MAPRLTVRTAITRIQQQLVETVDLALRRRFVVPDIPGLRAFLPGGSSRGLPARDLCYVQSQARNYRFDPTSTAADDGQSTIAPTDRGGNGRWLATTLAAPYGRFLDYPLYSVAPTFYAQEPGAGLLRYARAVQLFEGDVEEEVVLERVQGAPRPAFLFKWEEDEPQPRTNKPGCMYFGPHRFEVLVVAQNNRSGQEALWGSPFAPDYAQNGPGLNRMIGDLRYVLAGAQLGLGPQVERTEIGAARIVIEDLTQRFFVASAQITVWASYHLIDEDPQDVTSVSVQPRLADDHAGNTGSFPTDNYVYEGFELRPGPGLTGAPTPGTAIAGGTLYYYTPTAIRFPASSDTYLDLDGQGYLIEQSVPNGADPPPLTGILRVLLVVTDTTSIAAAIFQCPTLQRWRGPYLI